ncbi:MULTISPECIES: transporter substrate-binding domain-containing protein [unclassified Streptococcus]|uniref:transporter substrate-binding domain-containing protein n=1 Tax=Streptococcus TaxID=1301 RepID=UPI00374CFAC5
MMKLKKVYTFATVCFASLALAACGSSNSDQTTLEKIEDKGTLVVALNPEFPPFEYKQLIDGKDTIVGADIELAKAIGEELGVEVEFSPMSFSNVLASVQKGTADVGISGISATEERAKTYDFSEAYYQSVNKMIVKKDDAAKYSKAEDFASVTIGTQKGSIQESVAKEAFADSSILSLEKNGDLIQQLKSGQLDGVIFEEPIAKAYVGSNPDLQIVDMDIETTISDSYAVAMPKGSAELKAKIDKVVKELVESGKMSDFVEEAYQQSISK